MPRVVLIALFSLAISGLAAAQQNPREKTVRDDKARVEAAGFWMYNDLAGAFAKAKATGKPIVVVLRCLPCHECVKLDDDLVDTDPVIRPLLEQFICVRVVGTNGLDLNTFQYDTDQSFAVFMLNADGTIYGRFGTRSHRTEWVGDVSLAGMAKALQAALELHRNFPAVRESLAKKRGAPMEVSSPEEYPALRDKYTDTLNYDGDVVKSCIHCHQIGDAQREFYWKAGKPIPEKVLYPFPHPKTIGLTLDPKEKATIVQVAADSPAAKAGFQAGDAIETLDRQPLVSIADLQWVLHNASPNGATIPAAVMRNGQRVELSLKLADHWRRMDDISWRVTTWGLRRMMTGGMVLEKIPAEERGSAPSSAALRVKSVGQYGPHAAARKAGFEVGDVILSYNGQSSFAREADLHVYAATHHKPGDKVPVKVLRKGETKTLELPIQE